MRESKECAECGGIYFRAEQVSDTQWAGRKYCSARCGGQAGLRAMKAHQEERAARALELAELSKSPPSLEGPFERGGSVPVPAVSAPVLAPKEPILRELKIVRVGPNPRLVTCEYFELAQRRLCTVLVKRTAKFVRGMKLKMAEPATEEAYRRPWVYTGPAPKHRGRW